jgi:aspartyl-tRNA(Asn)/glutamyl-tRNA(Gln) amidotransferase subunit A
MDLNKLTIKKYLEMHKNKEINALDLFQFAQNQYTTHHKHLNIFIEEQYAKALDIINKNPTLPFIPMGVKDNYLQERQNATAGSKILKNFIAPYSSTVIKRLESVNCLSIGRLNMDEFAMGSSGKTSGFGPTLSPWTNKKGASMSPGGSSSGSASSLASKLCLFSLGSDTGGSVRQPAAWCGLTGFKPTYGLLSRYGIVELACAFDAPGFFTKTMEDAEILFSYTKGKDVFDFTTVDHIEEKSKKKIGVLYDTRVHPETLEDLKNTVKHLKSKGYEVEEVSFSMLEYFLPIYYILCPAEASSNLARYDSIIFGDGKTKVQDLDDLYTKFRSENFGEEVQRRIVMGNYVMYSGNVDGYYNHARKLISKIWSEMKDTFYAYDCILMPTTSGPGITYEETLNPDPMAMYLCDLYTCFVNILGLPAASIPTRVSPSTGTPLGIQIVSKPMGDNLIFSVGKEIEQYYEFNEKNSWSNKC